MVSASARGYALFHGILIRCVCVCAVGLLVINRPAFKGPAYHSAELYNHIVVLCVVQSNIYSTDPKLLIHHNPLFPTTHLSQNSSLISTQFQKKKQVTIHPKQNQQKWTVSAVSYSSSSSQLSPFSSIPISDLSSTSSGITDTETATLTVIVPTTRIGLLILSTRGRMQGAIYVIEGIGE